MGQRLLKDTDYREYVKDHQDALDYENVVPFLVQETQCHYAFKVQQNFRYFTFDDQEVEIHICIVRKSVLYSDKVTTDFFSIIGYLENRYPYRKWTVKWSSISHRSIKLWHAHFIVFVDKEGGDS